jgi:hypothetical protein
MNLFSLYTVFQIPNFFVKDDLGIPDLSDLLR